MPAKERYTQRNQAWYMLRKKMTIYSLIKAFTCTKCGHKPDKRTVVKAVERKKEE